jgi:hypothetical protein
MLEINKVSLKEMLNNSQGKSSLGLLLGFIWGAILAPILFISGIIGVFLKLAFFGELLSYGAMLVGAAGTLVGIRRFSKDEKIINIEKEIKENNDNINGNPAI